MKNIGKYSKERMQTLIIFFITIIVCSIPLFSVNCIQGHDLAYHLLRIESLKEGILMGKPFLKVNVLFFAGRGYASSLFYPDFLLYIPALLRCLGISINLSYHIFVGLCFAAAYLCMYYCMLQITEDRNTALISAIIYSLAQYHLDDVYTRAAVGEFTAYIFIPFLIYGLYELVNGKFKKPYLMIIGFSGVLLCHTITTVLFLGVYCVAFIVSIKKLLSDKKQLIILLLSAVLVVCLTSFYWAPLLEQVMSGGFGGTSEFDLNYEKLMLVDLFTNTNPGLGIALFIPLLLRVFINKKNTKLVFADLCMIAGILASLCSTGILPWARLQRFFGFMQFPWRTFMVATPLLCVAVAIYISAYFADKNSELIIFLVLAIFIFFAINTFGRLDQGYYSYSNDYYTYEKFTGEVIGGEWLPSAVKDIGELTKPGNKAKTVDGEIDVLRTKNSLSFVADESEYVDVPFIYYKGYSAKTGEQNINIDGNGKNGMCRVYTKGLAGQTITVWYKGTTIQILSTIVSIITFALAIFAFLSLRKRGELI